MVTRQNTHARYIMVGGFFGAGKTTAILELAHHLQSRGLRVGLITNNQSRNMVDTHDIRNHPLPLEDMAGARFSCRFHSLSEAADNLKHEVRPDLFLAESGGSRTGLINSVSHPLRRIYGETFRVAPLSVMVDPLRASQILGLTKSRCFSEQVSYIYLKQLEEADIIVINKRDLIDRQRIRVLRNVLAARFPRALIQVCSVRKSFGLEDWFSALEWGTAKEGPAPALDYELYAEGEARLALLNATISVCARPAIHAGRLLLDLARNVQTRLQHENIEIAHFKMSLSPGNHGNGIAVLNLVGNEYRPELSQSLSTPPDHGRILLSLRAEGQPGPLAAAVSEALWDFCDAETYLRPDHMVVFTPELPTYPLAHEEVALAVS